MASVLSDSYWIVNDTNPTTQVYSSASNAFAARSMMLSPGPGAITCART